MNTGDEGVSAQRLGGRLGLQPKPSSDEFWRRPPGPLRLFWVQQSPANRPPTTRPSSRCHTPRDRTKIELRRSASLATDTDDALRLRGTVGPPRRCSPQALLWHSGA